MRRRGAIVACLAVVAGALGATSAEAFTARGSVEQVYVLEADPGKKVTLLDRRGRKAGTDRVDAQGAALFRKVKPGGGYTVRMGGRKGPRSDSVRVLSTRPAPPSTDIYDQSMPSSGYGYLTTRDGTELAYTVHPPDDVTNVLGVPVPSVPAGPTPTLIEYSGYGTADPEGPESGISVVANLMGFTVVDVNMRGTGCSGGAFDFFEPLQGLDGYDVIETVARQPWVQGGEVGMFGISYGGISQLFTAQYNPPSLAAITPLSVIDQTQTTLYPGGILNTGFALEWAKDRVEDSQPAGPDDGQPWAWKRIQEGDTKCAANQAMHGQAKDLLAKVKANDTYKPKVADPLSPITFVDKIKAPVFMACQWQDEQTGGHCPTLASRFDNSDKKWFTFTNGTHVDSLGPETANRLYDFLMLYVAKRTPGTNPYLPLFRGAAPLLYQAAMGVSGVTLPPDPVQQEPTYEGALAAFEAIPPVRVLFDNGAGGQPGQPYPGFERSFPELPVPGTQARAWFLDDDGVLADKRPKDRGRASFRWDVNARPPTNFTGDTGAGDGGIWTATPPYDWRQPPPGSAASWTTAPLGADTTVVGGGAVTAWVRSSTPKLDLQATVTEVRPDGKETFVQGGWVRGTLRKLDREKSTPLEPVLSLREKHREPMPTDRFTKVTIPLYYQGHAYREGSQIRVSITSPNGDQPIWAFAKPQPKGTPKVRITHSNKRPSKLLLPVIPESEIPTELPPCPSLRGQPCRDYAP